ncbi:uncharacterized protein LOC117170326 [Belonocnema kinseyi]|uniref:uncharacterized protein LOC117170326 n=1 Tax=Belonocnema kinseyi TaxID=2817044 RepID=UPI00143D738F|nr:uncharacterized protein LOC117170326 [Belonocnema kinseyi]
MDPMNPKGSTSSNVPKRVDASFDLDKTLHERKSKENYSKSGKKSFSGIDRHVFNPEVSKKERENPVLLFGRILKAIYSLRLEQKELRKQITRLGTEKPNSSYSMGCLTEDLAEKYNLQLPVKTSQAF